MTHIRVPSAPVPEPTAHAVWIAADTTMWLSPYWRALPPSAGRTTTPNDEPRPSWGAVLLIVTIQHLYFDCLLLNAQDIVGLFLMNRALHPPGTEPDLISGSKNAQKSLEIGTITQRAMERFWPERRRFTLRRFQSADSESS